MLTNKEKPRYVLLVIKIIALFSHIPQGWVVLLARFSIAAVFWKSGQTKVEGFAIDIIDRTFTFGWPHLSESAIDLFKDEYRIPFISPEIAAPLAAAAEHFLPVLILLGLGTRFAALGLLGMTLVIEVFVYPDAYPTHGTWAVVLLYLIMTGPGRVSLDHYIEKRFR